MALTLALARPIQAANAPDDLSLEQLLETKVTSAAKYEQRQSEVAAAVSIITREDIKTYGWSTLAEALASLPGIHMTYDRQYTYMGARGFGLPGDYNTRILLAINGNRLNDTVYDGALIGREFPVDIDLIERIEFIAGPGGAIYGQNAMFGVVNVITRGGAQVDGGELRAAWQSPQSTREGRVSWGKVLDNGVDLLLSASGMYSRGENLSMIFPGASSGGGDIAGLAAGQDGERSRQFFARLAGGPLSFDLIYGNRHKDDPTAAYFADPLAGGQYERDVYLLSQLQYGDNFAHGTLNVLGRIFVGQYRYTGLYNYSGNPNRSTGASEWFGSELRLMYTGIADHKVMLGVELQDNFRIEQTNDDLSTLGVDKRVLRSGRRGGIYAHDEWRLGDSWSTTLGLRLDQNDVTGTKLSPRAALIWRASSRTTLKALVGRAHRAPNAYEKYYGDGVSLVDNPSLAGETIDTREIVVDHRLASNFSVRTSIYEWRMKDIVTLGTEPVSGLPQYRSGNLVDARGIEISAIKTWNSGARLSGSIARQDTNSAGQASLANSPAWLGRLNYSSVLPWGGLRLGSELRYDARRRANDGTYLDGYWLANVNLIAGKWVKGMELSLGLHNLFDRRYQHPGSDTNWQSRLDQDGRSLRIKVEYLF